MLLAGVLLCVLLATGGCSLRDAPAETHNEAEVSEAHSALDAHLTDDLGQLRTTFRPSDAFLSGNPLSALDRLESRHEWVAVTYRDGMPEDLVGVAHDAGEFVVTGTYGVAAARAVDNAGPTAQRLVYVASYDAWFAIRDGDVTVLVADAEVEEEHLDWAQFQQLLSRWGEESAPVGECATRDDCAG